MNRENVLVFPRKAARGDVLMILDADQTMPPEALPRFHEALVGGVAFSAPFLMQDGGTRIFAASVPLLCRVCSRNTILNPVCSAMIGTRPLALPFSGPLLEGTRVRGFFALGAAGERR